MSLSHRDYTVTCICPMGVELAPVKAMLEESTDHNKYWRSLQAIP